MTLSDAEYYIGLIDDHLDSGRYELYREALEAVRDEMERTNVVTMQQKEIVDRAIVGRLQGEGSRWLAKG